MTHLTAHPVPIISIEDQVLRRVQDRDDLLRLERIEMQLIDLNNDLIKLEENAAHYNECMQVIQFDIKDIKNVQEKSYPIIEGIDVIIKAGKATKFIFGVIIAIMGAVATVIGIIEYYRKMR